jgi:hypothetical protein
VRAVRLTGLALLGAVLLGLALRAGLPTDLDDRPLDPRNPGPSGLAGVVGLLEALDVAVDVGLEPPGDTDTRVFVPVDLLAGDDRRTFAGWVESGGTLIVGDRSSTFVTDAGLSSRPTDVLGAATVAPACDVPALAEVGAVRHRSWFGLGPDDATATGPEVAAACFPVGEDGAWLTVVRHGDGTIVALGSVDPFVNERLRDADNAVLAAALLGPAAGERLLFVPRPPVGAGEATLADLIADRVVHALWLVALAALVAVLWRSRRLGPPVAERLPPVVASAELARSVGDLLQRAGSRDGAAARLRADARSAAGRALGVPSATTPVVLADLVAERTDLDADLALLALLDSPVTDDRRLVEVAAATAAVRHAVAAPPTATTGPTSTSATDT